jgi:hypothetical protein
VKRLLTEGIDPTMPNKVGWTPLHAAAYGGAGRVARVLLAKGVAIDPPCNGGRTPLMDAARQGVCKAVAGVCGVWLVLNGCCAEGWVGGLWLVGSGLWVVGCGLLL